MSTIIGDWPQGEASGPDLGSVIELVISNRSLSENSFYRMVTKDTESKT